MQKSQVREQEEISQDIRFIRIRIKNDRNSRKETLESFETWCYRIIINEKWTYIIITNEENYKRASKRRNFEKSGAESATLEKHNVKQKSATRTCY